MASKRAAGNIPVTVPAARAIARREQFRGGIPIRHLKRLGALVTESDGELTVELDLSHNVAGGWLKGRIEGELHLTCQRGMHPFAWPCAVSVELLLVESEADEERVLQDTDPYLVQDDQLPLRDVVEDEVLLALPMMPRCGDENCIERFLK